MKRIILAGVAAGVAIHIGGMIAHTVLPLGQVGIKMIPNEEAVMGAMSSGMTESGFYFFPGMDMANPTEAGEKEWEEKYRKGPRGILIYHPTGIEPMSAGQIIRQLVSDILLAIFAAFILSMIRATPGIRFLTIVLFGPFVWFAVSVPYWNWYGFPGDFTLAALMMVTIAWFVGALVLTRLIRPNPV